MLQPPVLMKGSDPSTALHHNSILQCKEKAEEEENGDNDSSTDNEFLEEKVKSGARAHDGEDLVYAEAVLCIEWSLDHAPIFFNCPEQCVDDSAPVEKVVSDLPLAALVVRYCT